MQQNIRFPTSYHNKAVIAEGVKPILPLRWEFFFIITPFSFALNFAVNALCLISIFLCFVCSYKGPQNANDVQSTEACEEEEPQSYTPIYVPEPNVDTETRVVDEAKQQSISGDISSISNALKKEVRSPNRTTQVIIQY